MATFSDMRYLLYGVQFNHSFKLLDYWGEIADDILYKSEYFGSTFFCNISTQYTTERSLYNPDTGNFLNLSSNNLIFKYYIPRNNIFKTEFDFFCERVNKYLVERILSKYNLVIKRIGMVYACELGEQEMQKFSAKYFKDNIQGITDFRFAQRGPTGSGKLWYGVDDYINKIYTVGLIEERFRGVTYDFQLYFDPLQQDIRKKNPVFLNKSLEYFTEDVVDKGIK